MRRLESARKQERHIDIRSEPESVGKAAAPIFGEFVVVANAIAARDYGRIIKCGDSAEGSGLSSSKNGPLRSAAAPWHIICMCNSP